MFQMKDSRNKTLKKGNMYVKIEDTYPSKLHLILD